MASGAGATVTASHAGATVTASHAGATVTASHAGATVTVDRPTKARRPGGEPAVLLADEVLSNRFRIVRGLGRGGMGQVYEAIDLELDQAVALKVIRPELALRPSAVERFKREVRLARRVASSPHVCRIFDLEHHHDPASPQAQRLDFLTMELLPGPTLASVLGERGAVPPAEAKAWIRQLAIALHVAHQAGVVHGDFKPSNILQGGSCGRRWVVTDFGLARALERPGPSWGADEAHNQGEEAVARRRVGTPAYLAPEQWLGGKPSVATDLYALGLVIFEILSGQRPRRGTVTNGSARLGGTAFRFATPAARRDPGLSRSRSGASPVVGRGDPGEARRGRGAGKGLLSVGAPPSARTATTAPLESRATAGGRGFGEAWRVRHCKTGEVRVLKFSHDAEGLAALQREVTLYRLLRKELGDRDDIHRILD